MTNRSDSDTAYRDEIDGLRAIAVLAVTLFHAGASPFAGGFVGVDIFFVISGYLISGIILRELADDDFSIVRFYFRRAKRILPALFVVLLATAIAAVLLQFPYQLRDFGKELLATSTFTANFYYDSLGGYFDRQSHDLALLHTWSLAIEEQFYILFPFLLLGLRGVSGRTRGIVLTLLLAASLGLAVALTGNDTSDAFFNPLARFWQFLAGTLIAAARLRPFAPALGNAMSLVGLGLILWSINRYSGSTAYPGTAAILPTLGAALIIIFAARDNLAGRLLAIRPARFFGKISYSMYLWHWPIVVLYADHFGRPLSRTQMLAYLLVCTLLAYVSYRLVEEPCRRARFSGHRRVFLRAAAVVAGGIGIAAVFILSNGLPGRFDPHIVEISAVADPERQAKTVADGACLVTPRHPEMDKAACLESGEPGPRALIMGDSFAHHLEPGLLAARLPFHLQRAYAIGCRPLLSPLGTAPCRAQTEWLLNSYLAANRIDLVMLAGRWQPGDARYLAATVDKIAAAGARVVVFGPLPEYGSDLPRLLARAEYLGGERWIIPGRDIGGIESELRREAEHAGARFVSLRAAVCPDGACIHRDRAGFPLRRDHGHLTPEGSAIVFERLRPVLDAALAAPQLASRIH